MPAADESSLELLRGTEDEDFLAVWPACQPFTADSWQQAAAVFRAVRYLVQARVRGVLVDCGSGDPGLTLVAMRTLILLEAQRRFVLIDWEADPVAQAERTAHLALTGYDLELVRRIGGDYRRRLPQVSIADAAMLRISATKYEQAYLGLACLYPRLVSGGVAMLVGPRAGFPQGVPGEDYFNDLGPAPRPRPPRPLWQWIDEQTRVAVKSIPQTDEGEPSAAPSPEVVPSPPLGSEKWFTAVAGGSDAFQPRGPRPREGIPPREPAVAERYDYVPPGWENPDLLSYFPSLVPGNLRRNRWNFLRTSAPHCWRIDERSPNKSIGVLSVEEGTILYHLARKFCGQRGLAIGCHFGWSTAHLLAAGLHLDVLDPALSRPEQWAAVDASLRQIPTTGSYRLWAGYSPSIIAALAATHPQPWSFVFIDGDHEGEAPRRDAEAVLPFLAETAQVAFHDLVSPYVAAGLEVYRDRGWHTAVFNTMQILGIAWRGTLDVPQHQADPAVPPLPGHLADFPSSAEREGSLRS